MKITARVLINTTILLIVLLVICLGVLMLRMSLKKTDQEIRKYYSNQNIEVKIDSIKTQFGLIRYLATGNPNAKTAILFVHGAPGAMDMFNNIITDAKMQEEFYMTSVDRIGYGNSFHGNSLPSIQDQTISIETLFNQISQEKIILFGHSFGGPIVALLGYRNPNRTKHVVLAGAAVSAEDENFIWLAKIANSSLLKPIASHDTRVSSDEKIAHSVELRKIESIWNDYPVPVTSIHGTKDWLVPYRNHLFIKERIPKNHWNDKTLKGESHFFIGNVELIRSVFLTIQNK